MPTPAPFDILTDHQLRAITLMVTGASNTEIAQRMGVSIKTVDSHLNNAKIRLANHNRVSLARLAIRSGLVSACDEDDFTAEVAP